MLLPQQRLAALALAALGCCASAFLLPPVAPPAHRTQGTVVMMAQRHYDKMTSRGEFLLKSALATGAFVGVKSGLRTDGGVASAEEAAPIRRDAHDDDDDDRAEDGIKTLTYGPPLQYEKGRGAAMREMREVIDRFGGSVRRQGQDLYRVSFGGAQDLELRFTAEGRVHTRVGQACGDMRQINLLGEELAAKGGWQVKGYPLCLDPAMAKYV